MLETIKIYILMFFIYGVSGWIMESTMISIQNKKFVNRGFLSRTYMPNIWAWGSINKYFA